MLTRVLTLNTNPTTQITLYYKSRSNAESGGLTEQETSETQHFSMKSFKDDYDQTVIVRKDMVVSDTITNGLEILRAIGETKIVEAQAEMEFAKRLEADTVLSSHIATKRANQAARRG